jgi:protein-disulfide isomerase
MILSIWTLLIAAQLAAGAPGAAAPAAPSTPVEIVLFSDFQCPFCAQFARSVRELQTAGVEGVTTTVTFRHFPLVIHPKALLAHRAAVAAAEQGKFWEMHDLLFANQHRAQRGDLLGYAGTLGLDVERFRRDLDSDRIEQIIEADKADGQQRRVNGTPTFYVNGREYSGNRSFDQLKQIIQAEQRRVRVLSEISDSSMSRGPADAPVTLEVFADLESPVSRPAVSVLNDLMKRYPSEIRLQFRNFPLAFHPRAALAHEAAVVAAKDGRFWEFAGYLLDHPDSSSQRDLIALAGRLGLDETAFAATLSDHRYAARVDADLQAGLRKGIRGSPAILVNGRRIDGVPTPEMLAEYVETALSALRQTDQLRKR